MFTLIAVLGRMIKSSTQTTWWAILFRLLVMCVILILICSSIILEILPAAATSSKLLRSSTLASASICIHLIPLKIWLACATILCMILLRCTSLIAVILKLTLTILRSLSSISWYKSSKLSVSALTIIRSMASTLTRGIMVIIAAVDVLGLLLRICDFGLGGLPHFRLTGVVSSVFVFCV